MPKQIINCEYKYTVQKNFNYFYTIEVKDKVILENAVLKFYFTNEGLPRKQDVRVISFKGCTISKVPQGLTKMYPNLEVMILFDCKLKSIVREDLKEYSNLVYFYFDRNEIESLPNDLLADMKRLEVFSMNHNKIQKIGPNLLDGLCKLKVVDMRNNPCIDKLWSTLNGMNGNATLEEIKDEIREKYKEAQSKNKKKRKYKKKSTKSETGMLNDLKKVLTNDNFKDFTIKIDDEEFKIHKMILAARSKVFARMIEQNIDAKCLELIDMPKEIFREILNFIYTEELPKTANINYRHLFAATGKLEIEELKNFAAEKLIDDINIDNALDFLNLANKYQSDVLIQRAFQVIKENLTEVKLTDEMANQPEKLKKLLEIKRKKEEMRKEMERIDLDFEKLLN